MAELDHWQPVLLSRELGRAPRGVELCGRELVVFRTASGRVGALSDVCPHRGMRLSRGAVEGERLQCPYHGWTFAVDGAGESPGTPRLRTCTESLEALELHGAIWLKSRGSVAPFPALGATGYDPLGVLHHEIEAPLEVVLDNFTEVEHTATTHAFLGYPLEAMSRVTTRVETTADSVRVINVGPQKPLPRLVTALFGMATGDAFTDDWTTYFSPVHTVYEQFWRCPQSGAPRGDRLRVAVFFTPRSAARTALFTFAYATGAAWWRRRGLNLVLRPLLMKLVEREIELDRAMLEQLADKSPELRGRKLSRFDKALGENRRRIAAIYRGQGG